MQNHSQFGDTNFVTDRVIVGPFAPCRGYTQQVIQLVAGTRKSGWHPLESDSSIEADFYPIVTTVVDVLRIREMFA